MAVDAREFALGFRHGVWAGPPAGAPASTITIDWEDAFDRRRRGVVACPRCGEEKVLAAGCNGARESVSVLFLCGHIDNDALINSAQFIEKASGNRRCA